MLGKLLQPELEEMIHAGRYGDLRVILEDMSPPDIAELIEDLPHESTALFFRILPRSIAADVFEHLPLEQQDELLKSLGQEQLATLLNDLDPDDRTALLEELPGEVTRRLLTLLSPKELEVAKKLLGYPEGSIGRRMTPDYLAIRPDWTIAQVLEHIREHGHDRETINVLYVVDDKGRLLDDLRLREIILSPASKTIRELMNDEYAVLCATDPEEEAVNAFRKYDRVALPVTDTGGILVGIVTADDVLDLAEQAATEDIHKLGGLEALDLPYFATGLWEMIKKRAGWLVILFLGEMLTATAMGFFETEIERAVVLALFVPLIISSGGNSGSQAASLIIRALALGEMTIGDWWIVMRRELLTGLALGAILGFVGFLRISIWSAFSPMYGVHWLLIAMTIWMSLIGVVLWGTLSGSLLPILMKRLGADPATSSTPFVATLVDVTGLVIYFNVAMLVLGGTLLSRNRSPESIMHMDATLAGTIESDAYAPFTPILVDALDEAFRPTTATLHLTSASQPKPGAAGWEQWQSAAKGDPELAALVEDSIGSGRQAEFDGEFDRFNGEWQINIALTGDRQALVAGRYAFGAIAASGFLAEAVKDGSGWRIARWIPPAEASKESAHDSVNAAKASP